MTNFDKILIRLFNRQCECLRDLLENMTNHLDLCDQEQKKYYEAIVSLRINLGVARRNLNEAFPRDKS